MTQTTFPPRTGQNGNGDEPHGDADRRLDELEYEIHHEADVQSSWMIFTIGLAVVALLAALIAGWIGLRHDVGGKRATPAAAASTKSLPSEVDVKLSEFALAPKAVSVAEGGMINVTNGGTMEHNLEIKGQNFKTAMLKPGEKGMIMLKGLAAGTYTMFCAVPGHEAAGMTGTLKVGAATAAAAPQAKGKDAVIDFNATPGPKWHAFDPTLQPAEGATVHDVEFHATDKLVEVAPGVKQMMWTFNDQVPGPILRGHVGDVFNVTLTNDTKMGHSIDFHASKVAPNVQMRTINPGESLVYQFQANYAGIFMYHCGTAPALNHIGNGMFGALIVDPPVLAPVDHEYVMVQSELYTGPQNQPGDYAKMAAFKPDAVVFNGYVNQYKFSPIKVNAGERIRIWVLDAGPSENSSFHIVGTIWDTVYKEGSYTLRPGAGQGGSQTLDLQPAQGGFVEFTLDADGTYPMVTHKFANVGKGALGLFQVGDTGTPMSH